MLSRSNTSRLVPARRRTCARLPLLSTYLGHVDPASTYWYLPAMPELLELAADRLNEQRRGGCHVTMLAPILQAFFTDRLLGQRRASPHTVAAYRDAFRLLLRFALTGPATRRHRTHLHELDAQCRRVPRPSRTDRGNSVATRNTRLAAIHSLVRGTRP